MELQTRRYAQLAIPGQTEPRPVFDLSIPIPPEEPVEPKQRQFRATSRAREESLLLSEIDSVEFSLFTTEEIDAYAVVNVTSPDARGPGTIRDLRLGPHDENSACDTCSSDIRGCPGHFGKIILPRIMHPPSISAIILTLACVCNSCGGLFVTREEIANAGINRLRGEKRLSAIKELIGTLGRRWCPREQDPDTPQCGVQPIYHSYRDFVRDKAEYRLPYYYANSADKQVWYRCPDVPISSTENSIYKILNGISDEDAVTLGFTASHPRTMIMERLIVIPYCARPDPFQGGKFWPDDLSSMYQDIVKHARAYFEHGVSEEARQTNIRELMFKVTRLMNNDGKYTQGGVKVYVDMKKRIQGKQAVVRANIMGKRVNFAGRTVVGPGAYLRVDEVAIPRLMAEKLTRKIRVTDYNKEELQSRYDNNKVTHITMQSGTFAGQRVTVGDLIKKQFPNYQLNDGDLVERMLEDGDLVFINRQPTLHKQNMLACYAKIVDERIIRINLSITTPMNADFDGDEINVHVPQTLEAYAEAEQLLSVYRNIMSSESNKPIMGLVYDTLSGAYMLTLPQVEVDRLEKQIEEIRRRLDGGRDRELQEALTLAERQLEQQRKKSLVDPIVYNLAIETVAGAPQMATLYERLSRYGVDPRSGRGLISAAFPEQFDYNAKGVVVKNGVLVSGLLDKSTLGTSDGGIIAEMVKQLGGKVTVDFMSEIQFIVREFLQQHGLSIGVDDCIPDHPNFREQVDELLTTASMKVIALASNEAENEIQAKRQESRILEILDSAKVATEELTIKHFKPDNALLIMANSGAKGSKVNAVQIASALGQQKVSGQRIAASLPGNRALPSYEPNDPDPRARGFCFNSFATGLEPDEYFNHAQGGREGLTDTAINTARTGHLQHQIIKSAEDVHAASDRSIRTADFGIIEFVYGGDGFEASELGSVGIHGESVPFFRNLQQLADKVNRRHAPQ